MILWLALIAVTAGVLVALCVPLLREDRLSPPRARRELAIYRDQLAELQCEVDAGRIAPAEFKPAETEIQRKMLTSAETVDPAEAAAATPMRGRAALAALVLIATVIPIGAFAVYLSVGSPGLPSYLFDPARATAEAKAQQQIGEMTALVEKLAQHLKHEPNNAEGWALLARSYGVLHRNKEAAQAYERLYELSGRDVRYAGDYGEALVLAADGEVTPVAQALFDQVVKADASEPRARFYLGLAKAQAGLAREAIAMWRSLETDSPPGSAWLPSVRDMIASVAAKAGIDPASVTTTSTAPIVQAPGPTTGDIAAAQSTSPGAQQKMIRDMVEGLAQRLAANPGDLEGWKRLGQSYLVLNEPTKAQQAYARAVALAPIDTELLTAYADATLMAPGPIEIPPQSVDALRQVLKTDASNPTALWFVGLAESQANRAPEAAALWKQLLSELQPDTSAYRAVQARIEALAAPK
jgi:cytochrome c-type biogenesis protein CcmH